MKLADMTAPEVGALAKDQTLVIAPIAACEQHSRHLPTFTDSILCGAVAEGVEANLPDRTLLLPVLWLGASDHHLPWGGTLSLSAATHAKLVADVVRPLLDDGFRRLLILNGHGGNIDTLHVALRELQPRYPGHALAGASYWELAARELAALADGPLPTMGHACEFETAMMLHLRPDLVRKDRIADDPPRDQPALSGLFLAEDFKQRTDHGAVGYPSLATAEKGRAMLAAIIDRVSQVATALLDRPLPTR